MKSFPSAFTKDNLVQEGIVSTNIKTTLKNMAGKLMNDINGGGTLNGKATDKKVLGENLSWEEFDYGNLLNIDNTNYASNSKLQDVDVLWTHRDKINLNRAFHENARKIPALTLAHVNKYRKIYLNAGAHVGPLMKGASGTEAQEYYAEGISPSLFNGMMGIRAQGVTQHTPLMFSESIDYSSTAVSAADGGVSSKSEDEQSQLNEKIAKEQEELLQKNAKAAKEEEIKSLENEIKRLQEETIKSYEKEKKTYEDEIDKINKSKDKEESPENKEAQKNDLNKKIEATQKNIEQANAQLTELQNKLDKIQKQSDEEYVNDVISQSNEGGTKFSNYREFSAGSRPSAAIGDISGVDGKSHDDNAIFVQLSNDDFDFTDCSIKTLVALSNGKTKEGNPVPAHQSMGRAIYRYADFMFCKDLGKVSNNHLITLRKFNKPVGDNIFKTAGDMSDREIASTGRLIAWFGTEDNKLEEICKYNYQATWKEFTAKIEDVESKEDDPHLLPSIANMLSPTYNKMFSQGKVGNNGIYSWVAGKVNTFSNRIIGSDVVDANQYYSNSDLYYRDANTIYEPKNTIRSTHKYEGELKFNHQFTLTFSYVLRSYDGINPKSAFLDLLGNILYVTYKDGTFWGGQRRFMGAPRNQPAWKKINQLFNKLDKGIHSGIDSLFGCSNLEELGNLLNNALQAAGNFISGQYDKAKQVISNGTAKSIAKKGAHQAADVLQGMLKNKLGRPAIYAVNSLLTGENVGLWHVTIGNPRNPIMAMGNLILTDASIEHRGVLGLDDFPTELKVTVTLKHARPRDAQDIGNMYTCGQGGLLIPLNTKQKHMFFDVSNPDEALGLGGYGIANATADDIEHIWESF